MATLFSFSVHCPYGTGNYEWAVNDFILCSGEQYIENPMCSWMYDWKATNDDHDTYIINTITTEGNVACLFVADDEATGSGTDFKVLDRKGTIIPYKNGDPIGGNVPYQEYTFDSYDYLTCIGSTNIPIFEDEATATLYYEEEDSAVRLQIIKDHAINYGMNEPPSNEYEFISYSVIGTWDENGVINQPETKQVKGFRLKMADGDKISLYKIPGRPNGELRYGISRSEIPLAAYYTYDGVTWQQVPGQPTTLPFDYVWRGRESELGTFRYAYSYNSNDMIPLWENESDADAYNRGEKDITDATNWDIISGNFPIGNETGEELVDSEFGEVKARGFFSQQYVLTETALTQVANDLFDTSTSFWEEISKGLRMYGDNPIEAVMGLSYWPIDITSVYSTVSAPYIWFGGYGWETNGGVNRIIYPNGYKTLGTITIKRSFNNWRDYAPYTRLYVSLPYIGVYELELTRYYGKSVEVRYYFDTRTNGCIACLIANGHLMDYFNGQMGITMPITLTDYAGYANSQIATLLGAGSLAAGAAGAMATGVVGLGGAAAGLAGTAISGSGLAAAGAAAGAGLNAAGAAGIIAAGAPVAGAALGAKTAYGLSQNNINKHNVTKGGSSSMLNAYLPQYVEFIFEIQKDCAPDNYGQQYGYPSMKSGSIGSFSGFLKCQSVKLDCGVATENEKNQIKTMLLNGIYI